MSRETYTPPLTNAEIIQIAAARRAGDAILRKWMNVNYRESSLAVRDTLRLLGVKSIGMSTAFRWTAIARFRVVPSWARVNRKMVKPEPISELLLCVVNGETFLMDANRQDLVTRVTVPVELLALIDGVFASTGAYKVDGGEFIQTAIARAVGHVVKQEQERKPTPAVWNGVMPDTRTLLLLGAIAQGALDAHFREVTEAA